MYIQWKTISAVRNSIGIDRSYFQLLFDFTSTLQEASECYGDHQCIILVGSPESGWLPWHHTTEYLEKMKSLNSSNFTESLEMSSLASITCLKENKVIGLITTCTVNNTLRIFLLQGIITTFPGL